MADTPHVERDWRKRRLVNLEADDWIDTPDGTPIAHPPEASEPVDETLDEE